MDDRMKSVTGGGIDAVGPGAISQHLGLQVERMAFWVTPNSPMEGSSRPTVW